MVGFQAARLGIHRTLTTQRCKSESRVWLGWQPHSPGWQVARPRPRWGLSSGPLPVSPGRILTCFQGSSPSHVMRVVEVRHPGLPTMAHVHLELVGAAQVSKFLRQVACDLSHKRDTMYSKPGV